MAESSSNSEKVKRIDKTGKDGKLSCNSFDKTNTSCEISLIDREEKNKDMFDKEVRDIINVYGLNPDYKGMTKIKAYGKTSKLQFCKEQLEEQLGLSTPPNIRSLGLLCFAIFTEIVLHVYQIILYLWLYKPDNLGGWPGIKDYKDHAMYLNLSFAYFLPQIFLLEIFFYGKNQNNREIINHLLQLAVVISLGLGWTKHDLSNGLEPVTPNTHDLQVLQHKSKTIHYHTSISALAILCIYIATLVIRLLGLVVPRIYSIPLIGFIARLLRSRRVGNAFRHALDVFGLVASVTGFSLSVNMIMNPFNVKTMDIIEQTKFYETFPNEKVIMTLLLILALTSSVSISIVAFQVHKRQYHDSSLTYQLFRKFNLSKFASIYEDEPNKKSNKMTTPVRMY